MTAPRYLVFDTESVADGELVSRLRYAGQGLDAAEAVRRYRAELMEKYETDFIPYTFQLPVSVAVAKVAVDFRLLDLVVLDEPQFRPHVITEHFWRGWEKLPPADAGQLQRPLVRSAAPGAGRLPLRPEPRRLVQPGRQELRAAAQPLQPRGPHRSARAAHQLRLHALRRRAEPGAPTCSASPARWTCRATWCRTSTTRDACRRSTTTAAATCSTPTSSSCAAACSLGQLPLEEEQKIVDETKAWLQQRADATPAYRLYLDRWGDWINPWTTGAAGLVPAG